MGCLAPTILGFSLKLFRLLGLRSVRAGNYVGRAYYSVLIVLSVGKELQHHYRLQNELSFAGTMPGQPFGHFDVTGGPGDGSRRIAVVVGIVNTGTSCQ